MPAGTRRPGCWRPRPGTGHPVDGGKFDTRPGKTRPAGRQAPPPVLGGDKCAVLACLRSRQVRHQRQEARCAVHAARWETARQAGLASDERRWNQTAEPVPVTGQVNLRGLAPLAVAELLYGLQQRAAAEVTSYCRFLRRLAQELRQAQVPSLTELPVQDEPARRSLVNSLVAHLGRAFADPRTEIAKDRWDLTVLGHHGWLTFTGITRTGCVRPPKAGLLMICRAGAASRRAPGSARSSARWCACRRPCGPAAPIRARIRPGSAAPTSRRSCTHGVPVRRRSVVGLFPREDLPGRRPGTDRDPLAGADPRRRPGRGTAG